MTPTPPRPAVWLLGWTIPDRRREELLGDLEELFHIRVIEIGRPAARRWYWRQAALASIEAARERRRQPRKPGGDSLMQSLWQDVRYATRSLGARPGFSAIAILMLALGIGANATIFSWVNSVLLNPLPGTARSGDLVQLTYMYRGNPLSSFSFPDYRDIRDSATQLQGVAGRDDLAVGIVIDRDAERAWAEVVTANYFEVLGVPIVSGRGFTDADNTPGRPATAIISHSYWQARFAGDPKVVGREIKINAQPFTIIGVAAQGFIGGESAVSYNLWIPIGTQGLVTPGGDRLEVRGSRWLGVLARLAPGATVDTARAELDSTIEQMRVTWSSQARYVEHSAGVFTLDHSPTGGVSVLRPVLLILMAVASIVLLITCANLAGLLLARASTRQREIAIRLSIGAGRGRIVQQLLVEGVVLAGLGTVGALLVLQWTSGLLIGFAPPSELPIYLDVAVDARVVGFTAAVAVATVLLFALAPAALAVPADVSSTLRDTGGAGLGFGRHRLRRALVAAQVALSVSLLVGAGLCIRSLDAATRMTPGFRAEGVVVGWLDLFAAGYDADAGRAYYARMLERVRALPGVDAASLSRRIPLGFGGGSSSDITVDGYTAAEGEAVVVAFNSVGPDYAATLGIPITAGRDLSVDDVADRPRVAVISETMAQRYWKGRDAVGGRFMFGRIRDDQPSQWITVVGVSADVKQRRMNEPPQASVFVPLLQFYSPTAVLNVRAGGGVDAVGGDLLRLMRDIDPQVTFYNVGLLSDHIQAATFQQKLAGDLLVFFGGLALLLAGVGSYGVLSYLVGSRRREIGIRLAVGATRADVFRLVASSGARITGAGAGIGLLLSIGVGMGLRTLLIGISPTDPITYAVVLGVLGVVIGSACLLPARRAAALDPMTTLREE